MNKINSKYINEANRIRSEYLNGLQNLSDKEEKIMLYKNNIERIMIDIESHLEKNSELSEEEINESLFDELSDIDINVDKIKFEISILEKQIKSLEKESHILYIKISEKYPKMTEIEIQKEILYSLKN